jgi:hypothetical protein
MFPNPEKLFVMLQRTGSLANRQPTIIVYLRRQDEAHESWYNQTIKALGYHHSVDESLATFHSLFDYEENLKRWSAVFGDDALDVRIYEEAQFVGGTLAADFLNVLGMPNLAVSLPAEKVNTGLNYDLLQIQRGINRLPLSVQQKRRFHKDMIDLSLHARGSGLFDEAPLIDEDQARAIMRSYATGNSNVARKYFGRNHLFSQRSIPASTHVPRNGVTTEKLLYLLGWILARSE